MQTIWLLLRENMRCGNNVTDVIREPERCRKKTMSWDLAKEKNKKLVSKQVVHLLGNPARDLSFRENYIPTWFNELDPEDISRKVIEMIVQKASMEVSKPSTSRKMKSVLRIHNPIEMIERFEKYREKVKMMAYERYTRHLRSTVDGNELLSFYATTMACYSKRNISQYDLCRDPKCRVCTILGCNFQTENMLKNGIPLSRCSDHQVVFSDDYDDEDTIRINIARSSRKKKKKKKKNIRRAVIVCRTIAGIMVNTINGGDQLNNHESYSIHRNTSDCLIVPNPSALLPSFVVVFTT